MGRTTTVVFAVGIIGIIAWLILRERKVAAQNQGVSFSLDLGKAISAVGGFFSRDGDKTSPAGYVTETDSASEAAYALKHDVVVQQGNQLIDLNTGKALVFGP